MSPSSTATISGQPGPQTEFLQTAADICIYGGAAGGGKTVGLILEPLRHVSWVTNFTAVFFRRTTPQITNPGALWDESLNFYPRVGGTPHLGAREWRWPRAGKIKFSHLQFETTVYDWQGAQITLLYFDERTPQGRGQGNGDRPPGKRGLYCAARTFEFVVARRAVLPWITQLTEMTGKRL